MCAHLRLIDSLYRGGIGKDTFYNDGDKVIMHSELVVAYNL